MSLKWRKLHVIVQKTFREQTKWPVFLLHSNKDKCGSQPACLNHVQERRRPLKTHQSESFLPIGECLSALILTDTPSHLQPSSDTRVWQPWKPVIFLTFTLCQRESGSQSQADVSAFEIHFDLLNVKCVKWDVGLKCKIKCFVEEALWRRMKVGIEIIDARVSGINMVMRKTQLCCPCQNPERWICFTVQNAERKLCSFE